MLFSISIRKFVQDWSLIFSIELTFIFSISSFVIWLISLSVQSSGVLWLFSHPDHNESKYIMVKNFDVCKKIEMYYSFVFVNSVKGKCPRKDLSSPALSYDHDASMIISLCHTFNFQPWLLTIDYINSIKYLYVLATLPDVPGRSYNADGRAGQLTGPLLCHTPGSHQARDRDMRCELRWPNTITVRRRCLHHRQGENCRTRWEFYFSTFHKSNLKLK